MRVDGSDYRSIWVNTDGWSIDVIDQTLLPHDFEILNLKTLGDAANAIRNMVVRGAPLIGITAAFGLALALRDEAADANIETACATLLATRPTAVNLAWALHRLSAKLVGLDASRRYAAAMSTALQMLEADVDSNRRIGEHGLKLIEQSAACKAPGEAVNILTHCNAGWLATVDWGTATAPMYLAQQRGVDIHIWVDETRPRNQGASLTCWELGQQGVAHSLIVDNVGGHLMQQGLVDLCLVGSDRTTRSGDVCNKIGTYLKALAARDNGVPFYVCLPSSTIDWEIDDGLTEIPIEQRQADEVTRLQGKQADGRLTQISIAPEATPAANYAFDVTPARLVTGLITEQGVVSADASSIKTLQQ